VRRILLRAALRFYWRRPWQLALALAGISLGVAVYVGVDLANDSAARAFELSSAVVRGQTTHRLLAVRGDLDEDVYRELVTVRRLASAAPVVEAQVGIANRAGLRVPLLGVDPIQESSVRGFTGFVPGEGTNLGRLMIEPGTVLLPESLANELGATAGSRITLLSRGREVVVEVLGTVPGFAADAEAEPPILADIATAQELLGLVGLLSRIDLRLTPQQSLALAAQPPAGTILVPADSQDGGFKELAGAFRTNLTALGLLALVVGTFLIYGTMSFAIVQRRATLGVLRAIGLSQRFNRDIDFLT
jgi:putative ABC transport system permease protein